VLFADVGGAQAIHKDHMDHDIEIEALESTYHDIDVRRNPADGSTVVTVPLRPYTGQDALHFVSCSLAVELPNGYPEIAPRVSLEHLNGMSEQRVGQLTARLRKVEAEFRGELILMALCMAANESLTEMDFPEGMSACKGCIGQTVVQHASALSLLLCSNALHG
jgi:hypothetical protein